MQYQQLLKRTVNLIRITRKEWKSIVKHEDSTNAVLNDFIMPLAGITALAAFLGILFQGLGLEKALVSAIVSIGKTFGGVYFSFFVLQETARYFALERNKVRNFQLAGYSYVAVFVVDIVLSLIPELFFLNILKVFVFYLVWEGVEFCTKIDEEKRRSYVIMVAMVILLSSYIIEKVLFIFMPGAEIVAS